MFDNLNALTDADKKSDFTNVKNGIYILTVKEVEDGETDGREWDNDKRAYVPTGFKVPQRTIKFTIGNLDSSTTVTNVKGEKVSDQLHTVWINESNLRWDKKANKPKEGRAVLAALSGVAPDGDISEAGNCARELLVGRQIQAYLRNYQNKAGKDKLELIDIEPVKKN